MALQTCTIAGITVPDTPLITRAMTFARSHLSDRFYNHIVRSFLFSSIIASSRPDFASLDHEVIALSTILHDMSWSDKSGGCHFSSKDKRHEVDSANAARDFVREHTMGMENDWDNHRFQLIWDAIALHGINSIWRHKEAEVVVVGMGISADFSGPGSTSTPEGLPTQEQWDAVVKDFPRLGLTDGVIELFSAFCRDKSETTYEDINLVRVGEAFVDGYSTEGKT